MYTIVKEDCNCYKCSNNRIVKDFQLQINDLAKSMGFIPRNYDIGWGFNIHPWEPFNEVVSTDFMKEKMVSLKAILMENKTASFAKDKHPIHCIDCGRLHLRHKDRNMQTGFLCKYCFDRLYHRCADCGKITRREIMRRVFDGDRINSVCGDCYGKFYQNCSHCGNTIKKDKIIKTYLMDNEIHHICERCFTQIVSCAECGGRYFGNHMHYVDEGKYLCNSCMEENIPIKEYNYKPMPLFQIDKAVERKVVMNGEYYGIEYEVENCGNTSHTAAIKRIQDVLGRKYFYCKKDSSINHGFEIVTHPFSYPHFQARKKDWVAAIEMLYEMGFRDKAKDPNWPKSVGIHIHMNKKCFTTVHLYKFLRFFYDSQNRNYLIDISQRGKENYYSKFHPKAMEVLCKVAKVKKNLWKVTDQGDMAYGEYDKNVVVNLKPNPTVEVRLFASTMIPRDFFKNLEFVRAVYYYSKTHAISHMTAELFTSWVMYEKAREYKNLYTFICEKMPAYLHTFHITPTFDFTKKGVI